MESFWTYVNPTDLTLKPGKSGLSITARMKMPPEVSVTLLLRWSELVLTIGLLVIGGLAVYFRKQLAASWLISQWAPDHLPLAIIIIIVVAFVLGVLITLWKKNQLITYGIAEIAFALFSISQLAWHLWPVARLVDFLALGTALYVLSRGLGNVWDAFMQEADIQRVTISPNWQEYVVKALRSTPG